MRNCSRVAPDGIWDSRVGTNSTVNLPSHPEQIARKGFFAQMSLSNLPK